MKAVDPLVMLINCWSEVCQEELNVELEWWMRRIKMWEDELHGN
jgi:hypothetical protein